MEYRRLGRTGLRVSQLGMGTGGHDPLGQKSGRPEAEMQALLRRAFDLGINLFDTSPGYLDSELILGRALRGLPRRELVISTKIALATGDAGKLRMIAPHRVRESVEASLRRLQISEIDVMLVAVASAGSFDAVMSSHMPELEKLQTEGKIRFLGSSGQSRSDGEHQWLQKALPAGLFDVAMAAHNLINQSARRTVFPVCRERDLGVINVFAVRNVFSQPQRLREVLADLSRRGVVDGEVSLDWLVREGWVDSLVEAAYRYSAYTDPVTAVMTGTLLVQELEENVQAVAKGPLAEAALERLERAFARVAEPIGN